MITVKSTPAFYGATMSPVYTQDGHNLTYVLDSTNRMLCSMKYVADVFVNGATASRIKLSSNASGGMCEVTINRVLADYLSYDYFPGLDGPTACRNSLVSYSAAFGEETDGTMGCSGASFSITPNLAFGATMTAINACMQYNDGYDWEDFLVTNGSTDSRFLTNAPSELTIGPSESSYLYFGNRFTGGGTAPSLKVKRYLVNGSSTEFYILDNATSETKITAYGVGPYDINLAAAAGNVIDECGVPFTDTIIDCNTDYYEVCIADVPTIWPC